MSKRLVTRGFVLSTLSTGESDTILTLFSREFGKLKCIAKGAKKSKRRFMNALEPFTQLKVTILTKENNDSLCFLESALILDSFENIRLSYKSFMFGSLALELTDMWCRQGQRDDSIYGLLEWYCRSLDKIGQARLCTLIFKARLLNFSGVFPRLDCCSNCKAIPVGRTVGYKLDTGEIICEKCTGYVGEHYSMSIAASRSLSYYVRTSTDKIMRLKVSDAIWQDMWLYLKRRHIFALSQTPKAYRPLEQFC